MVRHSQIDGVHFDIIKASDYPTLLRWRNDERIFKWCRQNDLIDEENHAKWFSSFAGDKTMKMYAINNGAGIVGVCGLTSIDLVNQRAEFSLYLAPEFQGKGLARPALRLLVWHGFNAYPLKVIWGESFDGNPAMDIFEDVGFKKEGVRRDFYFRDGRHVDAHLFSIKREEIRL